MNKVIFTEILLHVVIQGLRFFSCQTLGPCYSKCGFWTNSISITLELFRNANSQFPPPELLNQKL